MGPLEITCQPGEHPKAPPRPLQGPSTRSPAIASRQTKFKHRERPSGNRLESPAYQALVKLSDLLPWWGPTAVTIPGWHVLRIFQRVPHRDGILDKSAHLSRHLGNLGTWSEHPAGSFPRIADASISGGRQSGGRSTLCRVPSTCRRHGDAMDEAIPVRVYNASPFPPVLSVVRGRAESLGTQQIGRRAMSKLTSQPPGRCDTLGYNASRLACASIQAQKA